MSGIGRYTLQLACALNELDTQVRITWLSAGQQNLHSRPAGASPALLPGCDRLPGLVILGTVLLPSVARRLALDVVHDPTGLAPFALGGGTARTVVTVHDVFAWSIPGHSTVADTLLYHHWLPRVLPQVDAVITDSQVSRTDIVRYLHLSSDRVHVIYPGVSSYLFRASEQDSRSFEAKGRFPDHYILFVGSVEKRKNVDGLLRAYAGLRRMGEQRPLVVAGVQRSNARDLPQLVEQLGLQGNVQFIGYVPDKDLPSLYSGADLFVFPSLYEGFGLPPLEAMACGTPVVCSNAGSLPEVVGDAALMVDPHDTEGLTEAMRRVLADNELRLDLRRRGLRRAAEFTWERTAQETLVVYERLLCPGRQLEVTPGGSPDPVRTGSGET